MNHLKMIEAVLAQYEMEPIKCSLEEWLASKSHPRADIITRWVTALESKLYWQSQHQLNDDYGYCCLGVLCSVLQSESKDASAALLTRSATLPPSLAGELGMGTEGRFSSSAANSLPMCLSLTEFNDTYEFTFEEIARFIKEYPYLIFGAYA